MRETYAVQKKNYNDYEMTVLDGLIGYTIGAIGAFFLFYVFFGNWKVGVVAAIPAGYLSLHLWKRYRIRKQKEKLLLQFKDFLESLSSSYSAGKNTLAAFMDSVSDMERLHGPDECIVEEVGYMLSAYQNGQAIEDSLYDLAERSGLEDILSFADVFDTCNRKGADMRRIINDTRRVITEKIEMEQGIQVLLSPGKSELRLMMFMPVIMILVINGCGLIPAGAEGMNLIVKMIALGVFGIAYLIGWKITDIKV